MASTGGKREREREEGGVIDGRTTEGEDMAMPEESTARCEFMYITEHGSPAEMIDRALGIIEGWVDRNMATEAEAAGLCGIHALLGKLSLVEKLALLFPDGAEGLEDEYGSRIMWQEVHDLIALRPALDGPDVETRLREWLDRQGWYDPSLPTPKVPDESLRAELLLRTSIDGLLIYLDKWLEE